MGWCQAFGPQIREGCDHSMVADTDRCSCPECGVVCYGKFVGCSTVWAAGPQEVTLRRPTREPNAPRALPSPAGSPGPAGLVGLPAQASPVSNGSGSPTRSMPVLTAAPVSYAPPPSADVYDELRPLLNALRSEVQVLSRKVDQIQRPAQASAETAQVAERALAATEALPGRIAKAAAGALREQHQAILLDLDVLRVQIGADAEAVHKAMQQPGASDRIMSAFDARFEWLINELSERFVILGNEIARIDRSLAAVVAEHPGAPTVQAQIDEALAPLTAEVERLARALEAWRPGGALAAMRRR